jgi:hypothetical protein
MLVLRRRSAIVGGTGHASGYGAASVGGITKQPDAEAADEQFE